VQITISARSHVAKRQTLNLTKWPFLTELLGLGPSVKPARGGPPSMTAHGDKLTFHPINP
jgi:hypothetical protein